jgi:hypothetical protein
VKHPISRQVTRREQRWLNEIANRTEKQQRRVNDHVRQLKPNHVRYEPFQNAGKVYPFSSKRQLRRRGVPLDV